MTRGRKQHHPAGSHDESFSEWWNELPDELRKASKAPRTLDYKTYFAEWWSNTNLAEEELELLLETLLLGDTERLKESGSDLAWKPMSGSQRNAKMRLKRKLSAGLDDLVRVANVVGGDTRYGRVTSADFLEICDAKNLARLLNSYVLALESRVRGELKPARRAAAEKEVRTFLDTIVGRLQVAYKRLLNVRLRAESEIAMWE